MIRRTTPSVLKRTISVSIVLLSCGCNHINVYRNNFSYEPFLNTKESPIATLSYSELKDVSPSDLHIYKIHKGYALKSHLVADANHSSSTIISKDKNRKLFAGIEWKWSF